MLDFGLNVLAVQSYFVCVGILEVIMSPEIFRHMTTCYVEAAVGIEYPNCIPKMHEEVHSKCGEVLRKEGK